MKSMPPERPAATFTPPADPLALLQAVATPLLLVDADGRIRWANPAAVQTLGAAPGNVADALWRQQTQPQDMQAACSGDWFQRSAATLPDGNVLWTVQPAQQLHEARAALAREQEMMAVARKFGRLGVWERDVRTLEGRWDSQVLRFWGLDPAQPAPDFQKAAQHVLEEDRRVTDGIFLRSLEKAGHYSMRYRVRGHDGQLRRIHSQWLVQNGNDGQPERVLGVMMDDTEPYALAQAAQELESQLALTVQLSGIGIWRHDLASERTHYSDQGWRTLGLTPRPEGITLDEARALIHPDDLATVVASAETAMRQPQPVDVQARYRHADGTWRVQLLRRTVLRDEQGRATAFLGVAMDITEQLEQQRLAGELMRRSELALQSAEERVGLAVRAAGMGTWELDLDTLEEQWDAQMWVLRGHPPQPYPMTLAQREACLHPEEVLAAREAVARALRSGQTVELEFRVVWPDGQQRWLASRSMEISDHQSGGRRRRIGVNWDITDSRTAETARREREVALRESQAKSQFLARMSHELRTPLNAVLGFAQLLLAEERGADAAGQQRRRQLEHIRAAGAHLLSLINDVLQLSGLAGGEVQIALEPVPLRALLDSTLPLLGPVNKAANEHMEPPVSVRAGALDQSVMADATRLRQVLLNLLSNAIKYNRPGGHVQVGAVRQGSRVRLSVADDGRGMDDAQLRHLFEPFNRLGADRSGVEGTGIGLAIVKALVERMGGSISVQSRPGQGSVFELDLAAADGQAGLPDQRHPHTPEPAPESAPPKARRQLLYIEDNPVNALIIGELLARRGDLALHLAEDGRSGVARAHALLPDLILLDMQLPDFDGYEVLRRLRAEPRTATIPCIALSANAMPQDIERALQAGLADYWTKPLDFKAFLKSLDSRFGRRV